MDDVELKLSPRVEEAHAFRVPCSFSPTGVHFVKLCLGRSTYQANDNRRRELPPRTYPHVVSITCECSDAVDEGTLKGMLALHSDDPSKVTNQCFALVLQLRKFLYRASNYQYTELDYVARRAEDRQIEKLGGSLKRLVEYLHQAGVRHDPPQPIPVVPNTIRQGLRLQSMFCAAADTAMQGATDGPIGIITTLGRAAMANKKGVVLAYRDQRKWFVNKALLTSQEDFRCWAEHIGDVYGWCGICGGKDTRRNHGESKAHATNALRVVKLALLGTADFPKVTTPERVPRSLSHPRIVLLGESAWRSANERLAAAYYQKLAA